MRKRHAWCLGETMQIDHVVVLMLENNSFDRMLGWMPGVDGVDLANPRSNPNLAGTAVAQNTTVTRQMKSDPAHDLSDVRAQMAGPGMAGSGMAGSNMGFVKNFQLHYAKSVAADWAEVMNYYGQGTLPVRHELARAFVVCDRCFSSMPG